MKLAFNIAVRFLKSGKRQTFLIALGIAIGVSVQIFIGSLIQGLQIDLVDTTIGSQPQITISSTTEDKLITEYEPILADIGAKYEGVKHVSPAADGPALIMTEEDNFSILVRGFDFAAAELKPAQASTRSSLARISKQRPTLKSEMRLMSCRVLAEARP